MFEVLSREGVNIMIISTSEIKISCVIDEKYLELAMRSLHLRISILYSNAGLNRSGQDLQLDNLIKPLDLLLFSETLGVCGVSD